MDKIEDAVTPWVHAGNQIGPGDRACGGILVCRGRKLPRAASAAKLGIFPWSIKRRSSSGSMPSIPKTRSFRFCAGDSARYLRASDRPSRYRVIR